MRLKDLLGPVTRVHKKKKKKDLVHWREVLLDVLHPHLPSEKAALIYIEIATLIYTETEMFFYTETATFIYTETYLYRDRDLYYDNR